MNNLSLFLFAMATFIYAFLSQGNATLVVPFVLFIILTLLPSQAYVFTNDWQEGRLEQWLAEEISLERFILQKIFSVVFRTGIPLLALLAGVMMSTGLAFPVLWSLSISAAIFTWIALGILFGALLLGVQQAVLLIAVLLFPLMIPEAILTVGIYEQICEGQSVKSLLLLQAGMSCVSLAISLLLTPALLRWAVR